MFVIEYRLEAYEKPFYFSEKKKQLVSDINDATVFADRVRHDFETPSALSQDASIRQIEVDERIDEMFNWKDFAVFKISYRDLMKWQESESMIANLYEDYLDDVARCERIGNWRPKRSLLQRLCDWLSS